MQIVFQRIGLSDSQIQMIMTGSSINVALLKQILNTQNVMWGAISSAMLHAGISYQYFYVIHHKEESGVTLLPGWPGTLPELKPEGCDNHPPNDDNGNVSMIVGTNTNGTRPIDSSQFPGGAGTLPILKPEVPPNHPPNDGNGNVSTIVAPNTNGTRPIDTIPLPGGPGTLPDLKPEVPPPNETSSTNTGSALPPGVSCPPGKKPGMFDPQPLDDIM